MIPARHRPVLWCFLGAEPGVARDSLAHGDETEPDGLDAVPLVVRHPLVVLGLPLARRLSLTQPAGGVGARLQRLALEHEGVATGVVEPAAQPIAPVLSGDVRPGAEQLAMSAIGEVTRCRSDELPAQLVNRQLAVAEEIATGRGDDEWRVGDHQFEALAFDRSEQVAVDAPPRWQLR